MSEIKRTPAQSANQMRSAAGGAWTSRVGWAMSLLFAAFMAAASVLPKFLDLQGARDAMAAVGWPAGALPWIGAAELTCVFLYLWRPTSVLGAILSTGLLGGAIASQLRVGAPLLSHSLFGLYLGLVMWTGLWLRDAALGQIMPWRRD